MEYRIFKNEISNLKAYYRSKSELISEIEILLYDLTGVKGISFDRQPSSYNPGLSEETRLELIDRIEEKEKELDYTIMAIERYEKNLNKLSEEVRSYVDQIFIQGKTFAQVAKTAGYYPYAIYHKIKAEVEKI